MNVPSVLETSARIRVMQTDFIIEYYVTVSNK